MSNQEIDEYIDKNVPFGFRILSENELSLLKKARQNINHCTLLTENFLNNEIKLVSYDHDAINIKPHHLSDNFNNELYVCYIEYLSFLFYKKELLLSIEKESDIYNIRPFNTKTESNVIDDFIQNSSLHLVRKLNPEEYQKVIELRKKEKICFEWLPHMYYYRMVTYINGEFISLNIENPKSKIIEYYYRQIRDLYLDMIRYKKYGKR